MRGGLALGVALSLFATSQAAAAPLEAPDGFGPDARVIDVPRAGGLQAWVSSKRVWPTSRARLGGGGERIRFGGGLTIDASAPVPGMVSADLIQMAGTEGEFRDVGVTLNVPSVSETEAAGQLIAERRKPRPPLDRRSAKSLSAASGPPFATYRASINAGSVGTAVMVWNRYQPYYNGTYYYRSDSAVGQMTRASGYLNSRLQASNGYLAGSTLVTGWDPNGTIARGSCGTISVGFAIFGFSVSESFSACSAQVIGINNATNNYYVEWQGSTGNPPGLGSVVATRTPRGINDSFRPTMWARWCTSLNVCPAWRVNGNVI